MTEQNKTDYRPCACFSVVYLRDHDGVDRMFGYGRTRTEAEYYALIESARESREESFAARRAKGLRAAPNNNGPWWSAKLKDVNSALVMRCEEIQDLWDGLRPCDAECRRLNRKAVSNE